MLLFIAQLFPHFAPMQQIECSTFSNLAVPTIRVGSSYNAKWRTVCGNSSWLWCWKLSSYYSRITKKGEVFVSHNHLLDSDSANKTSAMPMHPKKYYPEEITIIAHFEASGALREEWLLPVKQFYILTFMKSCLDLWLTSRSDLAALSMQRRVKFEHRRQRCDYTLA